MGELAQQSLIGVPLKPLFAWHERPGALERLLPPWRSVRVVARQGIRDGDTAVLELALGPLRARMELRHSGYEPGRRFGSEQVHGPFARWRQERRFKSESASVSAVEDHLDWRLPGGLAWLGDGALSRALARDVAFGHRRMRDDLVRHARAGAARASIAISGASGLVGRELADFLASGGHRVLRLVRRAAAGPGEIAWDPQRGTLDAAALEGVDAVVHLAGENIAGGRWTAERKRLIRDSRVKSTQLLAGALARLARPPRVLVSASAQGFYGDGARACDERGAPGIDFLAEVCRDWEAAADPARAAGIRVVHARFGVVLGARGGALARMLPAFRLGVGGPIGRGSQLLSWIALDDAVGALHHLLFASDVQGPVNLVAPEPASSRELARALGRVLHRPSFVPLPSAAVQLALGEMGQALLLSSAWLVPARLRESGFGWLTPDLEGALRAELGIPG